MKLHGEMATSVPGVGYIEDEPRVSCQCSKKTVKKRNTMMAMCQRGTGIESQWKSAQWPTI